MTAPRCADLDYVRRPLATPRGVSATEAARVQPDRPGRPCHDAFTRLLHRLEPGPVALWAEVKPPARRAAGVLVIDDSTPDKPCAARIELATRHWSGKHHAVVQGINLVTLLRTDGGRSFPRDSRPYDKSDGKTRNDPSADMLREAHARDFRPERVVFDGLYSSMANLKAVRGYGRHFLTRLKSNRLVSPEPGKAVAVSADIPASGAVIHLPGFGKVKVFRPAAPDGDTRHWCTDDRGWGS